MIIQTLAEYAGRHSYHKYQDTELAIALDLIRAHRALILNLQAISEAKLSLETMLHALLIFSEENYFIKYDPWDATIRIKQFSEAPQLVFQYNPFRDPANRHADGQKAKTTTGQKTDFLDWETFPASEHYLIWAAPSGRQYGLLVQPAPIVPSHLIIASLDENPATGTHFDQTLCSFQMEDMHALQAVLYSLGYAMGYNDKGAGASVNHFHTQAIPRNYLPIIRQYQAGKLSISETRMDKNGVVLKLIRANDSYPVNVVLLESDQIQPLLDKKIEVLAQFQSEKIILNTIGWEHAGRWVEAFFPRGQEALMGNAFKAGYVEMGGMLVIPNKTLFESIKEPATGKNALSEAGFSAERFEQLLPKLISILD